ncbi:MAG: hypothetical protein ACM3NQ_16810 [Bacteroidales bacterium]
MIGKNVAVAAAGALVAAFALITQTDASGRGSLTLARHGSATEARFGLEATTDGPFPSDWFTVPDHRNKTHRRVSLPLPDCAQYVSDCEDLAVLNELDGFNVRPRLSVPFSGPIDPTTVTSDTMFLVSLGSTGPEQDSMPWGTEIGIDQVVWDPATATLHVESDQLLAQHTRFALIVTRGIRDPGGRPIQASGAFRRFSNAPESLSDGPGQGPNGRGAYRVALFEAIQAAAQKGVREDDIAVASVFTTQSVTAVLEKMRDQIHTATPGPADFLLGPGGTRTVFNFGEVTSIGWSQGSFDLSLIRNYVPAGTVGVVAFGKYQSPDYLVHPYQYMPPVGTRTGVPEAQGPPAEIYFNLFLPSGPKPAGGWPAAIVAHGVNGNKNDMVRVVGSLASYGIATIGINMVGHGLGADGTLTVNLASGSVTFPAGGRGIDQNGDDVIGTSEGATASGNRAVVLSSDAFRQTAADLMQLVRVIAVGMDADGDGQPDLDASRVCYFGSSWGAALGTVFVAVEPDVRVAVLTVPADTVPISFLGVFRSRAAGPFLQARQPSLLNSPGISNFGGLALTPPFFDDNMPLRSGVSLTVGLTNTTTRPIQSPVTNAVPGAMEIQEGAERAEWVGETGSPAAYAPYLRKAPLAGASPRSVLFMIAKGDQAAPNPSTTAIVRAGDLADRTLWYRHDLYYAACRGLVASNVRNPHSFAVTVDNAFWRPLALAAQDMAGRFFASDGGAVTATDPLVASCGASLPPLFQFPIPLPLPKEWEDLNYIK